MTIAGRRKILVVEDESIVARHIQNILERSGYTVPAIASSGAEATERTAESRPDLVLMDIKLNGDMNGIETAALLRDRFDVPVVYLTAYADEGTFQQAKLTAPFGFLSKPFGENELRTAIEVALQRHALEEKLRESQRSLATILRCLGEGVIATDLRGQVKVLNPVAGALTGWTQQEAVGRDIGDVCRIVHAETRAPVSLSTAVRATAEDSIVEPRRATLLIDRQGGERPIEVSATRTTDDRGMVTGSLLVLRDISERRRAEEAARDYMERLQALSHQVMKAQEAERRRIARDLHDQIGQSLTALKLNLQSVQGGDRRMRRSRNLRKSVGMVVDTMRQVRELSLDLRPSILDDLGLGPALQWYTERHAQLAGLVSHVEVEDLEQRPPPEVEIACFRIAQEALTNVLRHAAARHVHVDLRESGPELHLVVCDDGVGFDVTAAHSAAVRGHSLGVLGMQERASLAGGRLDIQSVPSQGTEIHAVFPLAPSVPREASGD